MNKSINKIFCRNNKIANNKMIHSPADSHIIYHRMFEHEYSLHQIAL